MSLLVAGLALFLGIHLVPAFPPVRATLVAHAGEQRYKAFFSLASATGLVLIVLGFARWHPDGRLFAPVPAAIALAPVTMMLSFILFAAANMRGHLRRVLSHPMLLGVILWATTHLLANGDPKGTLLFGAFLVYAMVDLVSAIGRGTAKSFAPAFRYDVMAIGGGIVVALLVMTFHRALFGVAVVPFGV